MILAHNQYDRLQELIEVLDDERNDIYVHIDVKVGELPLLSAKKSKIILLEDRVDVRWGDVSVVEAEYCLMQAAYSSGAQYRYYHLLSGVDLPLKSQEEIHAFFEQYDGYDFIGYYQGELSQELDRKVQRYHLFARDFRGDASLGSQLKRIVRAIAIRIEELVGYRRYPKMRFAKGTQWFSITNNLVSGVLKRKAEVLKLYRATFCPDEIFLHTLALDKSLGANIFDLKDEARGCQRYIGWQDGELKDFVDEDYDRIVSSNLLFARKFGTSSDQLRHRLMERVRPSTDASKAF